MAYSSVVTTERRPNFLESEVGLVLKTALIPQSMGTDDYQGKKTVAAGTVFPSNDSNATGILYQDVDVTDGEHAGSILVAGRVIAGQLDVADAAKTALANIGIRFVDVPAIARGFAVTYDAGDGTGTPPIDNSEYTADEVVTVSTDYTLTKDGYTQTGWALSSGGDAAAAFNITADTTLYPVWTAAT